MAHRYTRCDRGEVARTGHFFDSSLLQSQLDTLEEPGEDEALTVNIELASKAIVDKVEASFANEQDQLG